MYSGVTPKTVFRRRIGAGPKQRIGYLNSSARTAQCGPVVFHLYRQR